MINHECQQTIWGKLACEATNKFEKVVEIMGKLKKD